MCEEFGTFAHCTFNWCGNLYIWARSPNFFWKKQIFETLLGVMYHLISFKSSKMFNLCACECFFVILTKRSKALKSRAGSGQNGVNLSKWWRAVWWWWWWGEVKAFDVRPRRRKNSISFKNPSWPGNLDANISAVLFARYFPSKKLRPHNLIWSMDFLS